jgi:Domain of unknown function (DUF4920)
MRFAAFVAVVAMALGLVAVAQEGQTFGKGVKTEDSVKVTELIAHADKYLGKTVRVEGVVADVCAKRGCWMDIVGDGATATIRIKVEDGVMVFPTSAKGKQAVAEGVFTKIEMTPDEARAAAKHTAEDSGQALDAKKAAPPAPLVVYEIRGTGAVIK